MKKRALITGITGQDGAYLSRFLLEKGYEVHGIRRRTSLFNTERLDDLYEGPITFSKQLTLHYGDMSDSTGLARVLLEVEPEEIYNLAAQSHVGVSFEIPEYTVDVDALGALRLLEIIRSSPRLKACKFYQASSSEMFGGLVTEAQSEATPFHPRSPYAAAKLCAYWLTRNYREAYGIFASNGILFNHESPLRGENFVSRKITRGLARVKMGLQSCLHLGNLNARRDWGHARDYVVAMWKMLQHDEPGDFVVATGEQKTVREFVCAVARALEIPLEWQGSGLSEVGVNALNGQVIVAIDERYFRPTEVDYLLGDASCARAILGWEPKISFEDLVGDMVSRDLYLAAQESRLSHPNS